MRRFVVLWLLCAGGFSSCSHPGEPPPPTNNKVVDSVIIIGAKTSYTHVPLAFNAHLNFDTPKVLFKWIFQDTTRITIDSSISKTFADSGLKPLRLSVLRSSDSAVLCYVFDTIHVVDTTHHDTTPPPPHIDTTSHNFIWTEFTNVGNENNMTGCWVFGPSCVYANNGWMHKWNGSNWETLNLYCPDPLIGKNINGSMSGMSMFAFDTSDYWLTNGIPFHYTGGGIIQSYRITYTIAPHVLHSAWGTSSNDMFFVGDTGTILHFDGTNWTRMSTPTTKDLQNVWGTASNDIWAAGYNSSTGQGTLLHYDGSAWREDVLSTSGTASAYGVRGLYESDSAGHKFIAVSGSEVFKRRDNGAWTIDTTVPNGDHIGIGVYGNAANDLLIVGGWGVVAHWNGIGWHRYDPFYDPSATGYGANYASIKGNTACVIGIKNGTSWVLIGQRQ